MKFLSVFLISYDLFCHLHIESCRLSCYNEFPQIIIGPLTMLLLYCFFDSENYIMSEIGWKISICCISSDVCFRYSNL